MPPKKKRYFRAEESDKAETPAKKVFLVRYHDKDVEIILNDGPFVVEIDAIEKLNSFLKEGVCSWLVTYNG
jgi:hypothetical protein